MSDLTLKPVSFSYDTAALATGHSRSTIQRAVRAGDLAVKHVKVEGKVSTKPVIERAELERWVAAGTETAEAVA